MSPEGEASAREGGGAGRGFGAGGEAGRGLRMTQTARATAMSHGAQQGAQLQGAQFQGAQVEAGGLRQRPMSGSRVREGVREWVRRGRH